MFLKQVPCVYQGYIYFAQKYSKNSNFVKYYYNLK